MSSRGRITRRGMLLPVVADGAPAARIRLQAEGAACVGCAAGCGKATAEELLLSGPALRAAGVSLPAVEQPVQISVVRHGLDAAAAVLFGMPLLILLAGAMLGEQLAEQGGGIVLGYVGLLSFLAVLPWLSPRLLDWLRFRVDPEEPQSVFPAPAHVPTGQISNDTVS